MQEKVEKWQEIIGERKFVSWGVIMPIIRGSGNNIEVYVVKHKKYTSCTGVGVPEDALGYVSGTAEPGDISVLRTAWREFEEELGIPYPSNDLSVVDDFEHEFELADGTGLGRVWVCEVVSRRRKVLPVGEIDSREVKWAGFVPLGQIDDPNTLLRNGYDARVISADLQARRHYER